MLQNCRLWRGWAVARGKGGIVAFALVVEGVWGWLDVACCGNMLFWAIEGGDGVISLYVNVLWKRVVFYVLSNKRTEGIFRYFLDLCS